MKKHLFFRKDCSGVPMTKVILSMFVLCFFVFSSGQSLGDFRSKAIGSGNWSQPGSWQICTQVTPTVIWTDLTAGYPGGTAANLPVPTVANNTPVITIQTGFSMTVNPALNIITGDIYVNGKLILDANLVINKYAGASSSPDFYIDNGVVLLDKGKKLQLPCGSNLYMNISDSSTQGLQPKDGKPDCNNNTEVIICNVKYTACTGSGNTQVGTFEDLNETAVRVKANLGTNPSPPVICSGNSVQLSGSYILTGSTTPPTSGSYTLTLISKPFASNFNFTTVTQPISSSINVNSGNFDVAGDYVFRLVVVVVVDGQARNNYVNVTVNVNPSAVAGIATSSATGNICQNTSAVLSLNGSTGNIQWQSSADGVNFNNISGANSATYNTGNLTTTTYYRAVVSSGSCPSKTSNVISVGVDQAIGWANLQLPESASLCSSVPFTAYGRIYLAGKTGPVYGPAAGLTVQFGYHTSNTDPRIGNGAGWIWDTATLNPTPQNPGNNDEYMYTFTPPNGIYYYTFRYKTGNCDWVYGGYNSSGGGFWGSGNVNGVLTVGAGTAWNGTSWTVVPTATNNLAATVSGSLTTSGAGLNLCSLWVTNSARVTVASGSPLILQNGVSVDNGSSLTVESDGSLVQINDNAANQGNINVQRAFVFSDERKQYNYVSSPVVGGNLQDIYAGIPLTLYHSEATNYFYTSSGANIQGRALAVKEPSNSAVSVNAVTANFTGVPFNGVLNYPLSYTFANPSVSHGYNLIGNPYPSNLDIELLYDNNNSKIESSFGFWDNRGNTVFAQQGSSYSGVSYAKYNAVSGTGVGAGTSTGATPARKPNRFVKTATGFMVRALSTANGQTLNFKNAYRSSDNSGPAFFGKNNGKDRYWIKLNTPTGIEVMAAVVYLPNGNNDFAVDDTESSSCSDDIYTFAGQTGVDINGRAVFSQTDRVGVGVNSFVEGNYTISLEDTEGIFMNGQNIYLKDNLTNTVTNLNEGAYSFTINAGQNTGRFELIYEPDGVLATSGTSKEELLVYKDGSDFVVQAKTKKITGLEVFDGAGRVIFKSFPNQIKAIMDSSLLIKGVYYFKIEQNNVVTTRKVIR